MQASRRLLEEGSGNVYRLNVCRGQGRRGVGVGDTGVFAGKGLGGGWMRVGWGAVRLHMGT